MIDLNPFKNDEQFQIAGATSRQHPEDIEAEADRTLYVNLQSEGTDTIKAGRPKRVYPNPIILQCRTWSCY